MVARPSRSGRLFFYQAGTAWLPYRQSSRQTKVTFSMLEALAAWALQKGITQVAHRVVLDFLPTALEPVTLQIPDQIAEVTPVSRLLAF